MATTASNPKEGAASGLVAENPFTAPAKKQNITNAHRAVRLKVRLCKKRQSPDRNAQLFIDISQPFPIASVRRQTILNTDGLTVATTFCAVLVGSRPALSQKKFNKMIWL